MSSKQNKRQAENRRKIEREEHKLDGLNQHLLEVKFPLECERLPLSQLSEYEQGLANKCRNHESLNEEELNDLKELLARYRQYTNDIKADEIVESQEAFNKQIKTEQDFLNFLDEIENRELHLRFPYNGVTRDMYFNVAPLEDSLAVKMTEQHQEIYMNLTSNEQRINQKNLEGKQLTQEEENIMKDIQDRVMSDNIEDQSDEILTFLAYQLTPPDFEGNIEKRKHFWSKIPFTIKISLYVKLLDILGLNNTDNTELFPDE